MYPTWVEETKEHAWVRSRKLYAENPLMQHSDLLYWGHCHAGIPLPKVTHHFHQLIFSNVDRFQYSQTDQDHNGDRKRRRSPVDSCLHVKGTEADCQP